MNDSGIKCRRPRVVPACYTPALQGRKIPLHPAFSRLLHVVASRTSSCAY